MLEVLASKKLLLLALILLSTSGSITKSKAFNTPLISSEIKIQDPYVSGLRSDFEERLFSEVDKYIARVAPGAELSGADVSLKCLEYNTDIVFVLAQALLESHFGTRGKAKSTNSVWNVGTYDNGKILYTYKHPNKSIEPYLSLLKNKYLINITSSGDTIQKCVTELLQDYTNINGLRFASAKTYENRLRKLIIEIDVTTRIGFYQDILKLSDDDILTYFSPNEEDYFDNLIASR